MQLEEIEEKDIRCECGKLLAKVRSDGKIMVWCKQCKKEVELEVEPHEPKHLHRKNLQRNKR